MFHVTDKNSLLLRFLRTSRGPSLPFYLSRFFCVLNLLFLLFLLACVFTLQVKFLLLLRSTFADISRYFFALQTPSLFLFVILAILAIFARVCFTLRIKILVTFADFSRAFFAFLPFKSFRLLNLLFLRYLLACVSRCKRNSYYFCDFGEICGLLEGLLCLFTIQVFSFVKFVILAILVIIAFQFLPKFLVNHLLQKLR